VAVGSDRCIFTQGHAVFFIWLAALLLFTTKPGLSNQPSLGPQVKVQLTNFYLLIFAT